MTTAVLTVYPSLLRTQRDHTQLRYTAPYAELYGGLEPPAFGPLSPFVAGELVEGFDLPDWGPPSIIGIINPKRRIGEITAERRCLSYA